MNQNHAIRPDAMPGDSKQLLEQENLRLRARVAELERLVVSDTLTPLFNRRYFVEELERWCWRAHRYGGSYGLLYFDVDKLKLVNDTHGHVAGDAVLVGVAKALQGAVRKSDVVARLGGDEFAILLDNIPSSRLPEKTLAMRKLLTDLPVATNGPTLKVSVSVGECPIGGGSRAPEVLSTADKAMYADKRTKYGA